MFPGPPLQRHHSLLTTDYFHVLDSPQNGETLMIPVRVDQSPWRTRELHCAIMRANLVLTPDREWSRPGFLSEVGFAGGLHVIEQGSSIRDGTMCSVAQKNAWNLGSKACCKESTVYGRMQVPIVRCRGRSWGSVVGRTPDCQVLTGVFCNELAGEIPPGHGGAEESRWCRNRCRVLTEQVITGNGYIFLLYCDGVKWAHGVYTEYGVWSPERLREKRTSKCPIAVKPDSALPGSNTNFLEKVALGQV